MSKRRQSADIPRKDLINMIALLRGSMHDLIGFVGDGDDEETRNGAANAKRVMRQTTFDVSPSDEDEAEVSYEAMRDILRRVVMGEHFTAAEVNAALRGINA